MSKPLTLRVENWGTDSNVSCLYQYSLWLGTDVSHRGTSRDPRTEWVRNSWESTVDISPSTFLGSETTTLPFHQPFVIFLYEVVKWLHPLTDIKSSWQSYLKPDVSGSTRSYVTSVYPRVSNFLLMSLSVTSNSGEVTERMTQPHWPRSPLNGWDTERDVEFGGLDPKEQMNKSRVVSFTISFDRLSKRLFSGINKRLLRQRKTLDRCGLFCSRGCPHKVSHRPSTFSVLAEARDLNSKRRVPTSRVRVEHSKKGPLVGTVTPYTGKRVSRTRPWGCRNDW